MKSDIKKLSEIASNIVEENEGVLLSGSLGLNFLGIKTRREPTDIDLYLPYGQKFKMIEGMKFHPVERPEDYEDQYYQRNSYKIDNVIVDVFQPLEEDGELKLSDEQDSTVLAAHLIIGFKVHHALMNTCSAQKHKDDISFILISN